MRKLEILSQIIRLNDTLFEALDYVKQNIDANLDTQTILTDVEMALETMVSNASLILDDKKVAEIHRYSKKLIESCDTLISDRNSADSFFENCKEWKNISERYFYVETINNAISCSKDDDELAIELLELILSYNLIPLIKSLACYALSRKISACQPLKAYNLGIEAFEVNNSICANITENNSPIHDYVYNKVEDIYFEDCPICHEGAGFPYYCSMPLFMSNYTSFFNPVKLWMKCKACGQLFAYNFPKKLVIPQPDEEELGDEIYMKPRPMFLPIFGSILKRILSYSNGKKLLEVGAGTGELIAAALEYGCEVEAIEISKRQSLRLKNLLEVDVHCMDFTKFNTSRKFNIITMGDVIEHIMNPIDAIIKAFELLEDEGILWISTPNLESGYSRIMKFTDAMWNEPWHFTYFSYSGLKELLNKNGFSILDYEISTRYGGSMEIICKKNKLDKS